MQRVVLKLFSELQMNELASTPPFNEYMYTYRQSPGYGGLSLRRCLWRMFWVYDANPTEEIWLQEGQNGQNFEVFFYEKHNINAVYVVYKTPKWLKVRFSYDFQWFFQLATRRRNGTTVINWGPPVHIDIYIYIYHSTYSTSHKRYLQSSNRAFSARLLCVVMWNPL